MKKYIFFALLSVLACASSIAQSPSFEWGSYIGKEKTGQATARILYADANYFYTLNEEATTFFKVAILEKFNSKFERVYSKTLEPPVIEGEYLTVKKVAWVNDKIYLFMTGFFKKTQQFKLYTVTVDADGNVSTPQVLDNITAEKRGTAEFDVQVSEDRTKILVVKEAPFVKGVPTRQATATVFSVKENTNYQKTFELNDGKSSVFKKVYLNNEGAVFLVRESARENYNISYSGLFIHPLQEKAIPIELAETTKMPLDFDIKTAKDGNIVIGGLYTENLNEKINDAKSNGTFLSKYDKNSGAKLFSVYQAYDQEIVSKLKITAGNTLRSYVLKSLLLKDNGGYFLVVEESWTKEELVTVNSLPVTTIEYNTGPLIITQLNAEGNKDFQKLFIKRQQSKDDLGRLNSILAYTKANKLYLFYNDYAYKYDDKKQVIMVDPRLQAPMPVLTKVESNGTSVLDPLENSKVGGMNGTTFFRTDNYYIRDESTILISAISNSYFAYGKMIIQ